MFTEKNVRNVKYCITDSDRHIHYNAVSGPGWAGGRGEGGM